MRREYNLFNSQMGYLSSPQKKDDTDGGMKLVLIEELEAHLHPQAQLRLISYLQNEYNENDVQIIISTHSPILASKINFLLDGNLYKAERIVRKLLCRIFHYAKVRHPVSGKEYSVATIKRSLADEYREIYRQWIYEMSRLQNMISTEEEVRYNDLALFYIAKLLYEEIDEL